ncbi:MAG: hypothetical protein K2O73_04260 [Lachnospiraceae bacterium]|nr:hypothetical protein [Lachnospiraceae bacterium]MDE7436047.1 hypothetical protein [Lachnospiraceae bacterium]
MKKAVQLLSAILFIGILFCVAYTAEPEQIAVSDDFAIEGKYVSAVYVTQHGEKYQEQYRKLTLDSDKDVFVQTMEMLTDMIEENAYSERESHSPGSVYIIVNFSDGTGETYYVPENTSYSTFFTRLVESRFQQLS